METDDNGKKIRLSHKRWRLFDVQQNLNEFDRKKMGYYHDHYFKKEVFLLADV